MKLFLQPRILKKIQAKPLVNAINKGPLVVIWSCRVKHTTTDEGPYMYIKAVVISPRAGEGLG